MTLTEQVQARIVQIDQQIARTKADADQAVSDLKATKQILVDTVTALAKVPEADTLIPKLKAFGLL